MGCPLSDLWDERRCRPLDAALFCNRPQCKVSLQKVTQISRIAEKWVMLFNRFANLHCVQWWVGFALCIIAKHLGADMNVTDLRDFARFEIKLNFQRIPNGACQRFTGDIQVDYSHIYNIYMGTNSNISRLLITSSVDQYRALCKISKPLGNWISCKRKRLPELLDLN